jgi:hypothetical protein
LLFATTVKFLRNFNSERLEESMSTAGEGKTSSAVTVAPTKEERRAWRWTVEKSYDDRPLTESMARLKLSLLPGGSITGAGEDERVPARVDGVDPFRYLGETTTFTTLISTRHEPIASAVYRQKMGTVLLELSLLESGARLTRAFPINEYSGGGLS